MELYATLLSILTLGKPLWTDVGITAPLICVETITTSLVHCFLKFPRLRSYKRKHNASLFCQQDRLGFHQIRFKVTYFSWTGQYKMVISVDFRQILLKTKWNIIKIEYVWAINQELLRPNFRYCSVGRRRERWVITK